MRRPLLPLLAVATSAALALGLVQERVKKNEPKDFGALHAALGKAWTDQEYGTCLDLARELSGLITQKRTEVILAALPAAPEGFEVEKQRENDQAGNPFAGAMVGFGSIIEQKYKETGGSGRIDVTVTADSPLIQMFKMWAANPEMLGADAELVKYGEHSAVLRKEGSRWSLQILIGDDLCEAKANGKDDEFLLKMFDQAAVDKLAGALSK